MRMSKQLVGLIILILVGSTGNAGPFEQTVLTVPDSIHAIKAGDWDGDGDTDLLVMGVERWHVILQEDGAWQQGDSGLQIIPDSAMIVYDLGNIDDQPDIELIFCTRDGIFARKLSAENAEAVRVAPAKSMFTYFHDPAGSMRPFYAREVQIVGEMEADRPAALFVPTMNGLDVFSFGAGRYMHAASIEGVAERVFTHGRQFPGGEYRIRTMRLLDLNNDGRKDLVFTFPEALHGYLQQTDGTFSSQVTIPLPATFSRSVGTGEKPTIKEMRDLDGDGWPEIIADKFISQSILNPRTQIQTYFGQPGADGVVAYPNSPDHVVVVDGIATPYHPDFDQDGDHDMVVSRLKLNIFKILKAFITSTINWEIWIYPLDADGHYPKTPERKFSAKMQFQLTSTSSTVSGSSFGERDSDFNGDGIPDLGIQSDDEEISIFPGGVNGLYDTDHPVRLESEVLRQSYKYKVTDLDNDNATDILFYQDNGTELQIFLSRL